MNLAKDEIETIRELANLNIEHILDLLGITYKEKYHSYVGPCEIHKGTRLDAFSWHVDRGIWKCFSRGCNEKYGSDIYGLIRGIKKLSFGESVTWVKKCVNLNMSSEELKSLKDNRANKDFIVSVKKKATTQVIYPPESLQKLRPHDYLENRGYPREVIERYHIGACLTPNMYMSNRIVIPVINVEGEIVGFTGRTLDEDWEAHAIPKWKHSLGNWIETNVFNAQKAAEFIRQKECAILCEGPLDVLRLEEAGVRNSVAIMGKTLHNGQMTLLMNMGATRLMLALDNDTAGRLGTSSAMKKAACLFDVSNLEIPSDKKDIGEMSKKEILEIFNDKFAAIENVRN